MSKQELTKEEYHQYLTVVAEKKAVKELMESLKNQLTKSIIVEDVWWRKMAEKYELDNQSNVYKMEHSTMSIVAIPREGSEPKKKEVKKQPGGIRMLERTPEMDELLSPEELAEMKKMKAEIIKAREEQQNES